MANKLYQVSTNSQLDIYEVEYIRKTESYYWTSGTKMKDALNTNYRKSFDTKEEAIAYLQSILEEQIRRAKWVLDNANEQLIKFKSMYRN